MSVSSIVSMSGPFCRIKRVGAFSRKQVRDALLDGQIQPWFQPKFCLRTGEVSSVEVLARWCHPKYGVLPPLSFLHHLRNGRLMDQLLFSQMSQSFSLLKKAECQSDVLNLAFNLQSQQLANEKLPSQIQALLKVYGVACSRITLEVTENEMIQATERSRQVCVQLRDLGCSISIDDYGTGYSSLHRLCQLPFNEIKLDALFVRLLGTDPRGAAVISSTLALGEILDVTVVAEGVETSAQHQTLLEMGCRVGQGYLCSPALNARDILSWLAVRRVEQQQVVIQPLLTGNRSSV